ncbi:MAG: NAD regulator [Pseudomonadota bacterium]
MQSIGLDLTAAVVALVDGNPAIVAVPQSVDAGKTDAPDPALPSGPFEPLKHRTLELGLRGFVEAQTGFRLGYIEQLYAFGDRGRHATAQTDTPHMLSVGYVALTRAYTDSQPAQSVVQPEPHDEWSWQHWYGFFPWEDWRDGRPAILEANLLPRLRHWLAETSGDEPPGRTMSRQRRAALAFGATLSPTGPADEAIWDEERVLERYELLYEAGLVGEAWRDGRTDRAHEDAPLGRRMALDHRRILATAIARLRGKMKYRPVVFEMMPEAFTLTDLQLAVEAISGRRLHKQNFRRLVDRAGLVEPTGGTAVATGGRPAALYRFRREVTAERPAAGLRLGQSVVR